MPDVNPNLWQRIKTASRYIRNKPAIVIENEKKTPYSTLINLGNTPQYSLQNFEDFYKEGFEENSLIYSAIMYKAKSITQAKLTAYQYTDNKGNFQKLEWGNDLQRLLDNPNPYQSGDAFHSLQNVFFNLTGNAFTFIERNGKDVKSLWPLNPAWVTIVPDNKGEILGYEYKPLWNSGQEFVIERNNMIHWKLPNPNDQLAGLGFGMSPVLALARSGDVDNMITRFLNVFFKNGTMPAGILKFKDMSLDDDDMNRIRTKWKETYGGYTNWSDIGILDQYGDYQRIGLTIEELDFEVLDKRNETRIFATLGVPIELLPTVSGLQGSTYNNKAEARKMFWQDTVIYELEVAEQEIGKVFNDTETGIFIKWDLTEVSALKGDVSLQVEAASKLYAMKVPPRIAFDTVGLVVTEYDGIDDVQETPDFGGFGNTGDSTSNSKDPKTDTANQDENAKNQPLLDESGLFSKSLDLESKKKVYEQFDKMIVGHEPSFLEASKKAFEKDRKEILSIVSRVNSKALESKSNIVWNNAIDPANVYLFSESKTNWRNEFTPLIENIYGDTENFWMSQMGIRFNIRNLEGELALDQYTLVFADQIAQTNSTRIKEILQEGMKQGYTINQMTNQINDIYDGWSDWRGELISRTETTRAANDGARKLYKRWGIEQKEWLATADDRTRDTHLAMNEQIRDIDKPFDSPSGAKLMQPGDSSAPLSETAACRCTVLPVLDKTAKIEDTVKAIEENERVWDFSKDQTGLSEFEDFWEKRVNGYPADMKEAFTDYTGGGYGVNRYLRSNDLNLPTHYRNVMENVDKDFKESIGQRVTLYRGVTQGAIDNLGLSDIDNIVGVVTSDKGYMSTSVKTPFSGRYTFIFEADENIKGIYLNSISNYGKYTKPLDEQEFEYLLPRNTEFQVTKVEKDFGNVKIYARILNNG